MSVNLNVSVMKYKDPSTDEYKNVVGALGDSYAEDMIAPKYEDLTFPVTEGQLCIHNNSLYKSKQDISASESWTEAHWEATTIDEGFREANEGLTDLKSQVSGNLLSVGIKNALLACFAKVAWVDDSGQDYYDALEDALYPQAGLDHIEAVYTQTGTVYTTDSLDSLKADLVVTASYDDGTTATVASTDYTLSGTLTAGTSTITVSYGGKITTFTVTVTTDTTAQIAQEDKYIVGTGSSEPIANAKEHAGITVKCTLDTATTVLHPAGVIVQDGLFEMNKGCLKVYNGDTYVNYADEVNRWAKAPAASYTEFNSKSWNISSYDGIEFSVDMRYLDDTYMYDYTSGKVWFAGKNTPYYGMSNISEAN